MKNTTCEMESTVLALSREGRLDEPARRHLSACTSCAAALRVDRILTTDSMLVPSLDALPDPTLIWWRARQRARLHQVERATLPIQITERLAIALGLVGLLIGGSLSWPVLRQTLGQWSVSWGDGLMRALPLHGSSMILALFCSVVVLIGFGLYSQWVEG